jgi:hypothetical protein
MLFSENAHYRLIVATSNINDYCTVRGRFRTSQSRYGG